MALAYLPPYILAVVCSYRFEVIQPVKVDVLVVQYHDYWLVSLAV